MPSDHGWILLKSSTDGQFYFVVESENDQVLVTSETYVTKQGARNGIEALKRVLPGAQFLDLAK